MRSLILRGSIVVIALGLLWLLYSVLPLRYEGVPSLRTASPAEGIVARSSITDVEQIPIYPNATEINVESQGEGMPTRRVVSYTASSSPQEVKNFYIVKLAQAGWNVVENQIVDNTVSLISYWPTPDDHPAASFPSLVLSIHMTAVIGGTAVDTWSERVPDSAEAPLYPGAEMIQNYEEPIGQHTGLTQKVTSFKVTANPDIVENYYRSLMAQMGWWFADNNAGGNEMPGLYFYYFSGSPDGGWGASVSVLVERQDDDTTEVEIRMRGDHFNPPVDPTPNQ